jgi:beta-glucanase (GH16 family)
VGGHGWGNNELQYYTEAREENARVGGGVLTIEARRESYQGSDYTSARLITKNKGDWLYGRFEIRAKLPEGRGTWPAVWMLPTDWVYGGWPRSGEIDIMEHVGYDQNRIHATIHTEDFNHMKGTQVGNSIMASNVAEEFHVYAMEWRPDRIDAFLDGERYFTVTDTGGGIGAWPFDQRFHLLLNIAVGGNWGGVEGVDPSVFPQTMEVDYVRVYEFDDLTVPVLSHDVPGIVQAEDFDSQAGVQMEATEDRGGGQNIGWLTHGDWAEYALEADAAGSYALDLRYASPEGIASVEIRVDDGDPVTVGPLPATGGWQSWETMETAQLALPAGSSTLRLTIDSPEDEDLNINWMELRTVGGETWAGYPLIENEFVDTGGFLGYLYVGQDPFVWCYDMERWIFLPEENAMGSGAWLYLTY